MVNGVLLNRWFAWRQAGGGVTVLRPPRGGDGAIEEQFVEHRQTLCVRPAVATGTVVSDGGQHIRHRDDA